MAYPMKLLRKVILGNKHTFVCRISAHLGLPETKAYISYQTQLLQKQTEFC